MSRHSQMVAAIIAVLAAACTKGEQAKSPADSTARNLTLAPADSSAPMQDQPVAGASKTTPPAATPPASRPPAPKPAAPTTRTAPAGSFLDLAVRDTLSSRFTKAGDPFVATLVEDVKDARGQIVLPAGTTFHGSVLEVKPSPNPETPGTLKIAIATLDLAGKSYAIGARIDSLETVREGRGVTGGDVAKTGAGAAAGAILGRVLTKNTAGTVIGGVVGGAIGAGVAVRTKDADIVLPKGAHINATLVEPLTVPAK